MAKSKKTKHPQARDHPNSLANLRKSHGGGKRPRKVTTLQEDLFCFHLKLGKGQIAAARLAGFDGMMGYKLMNQARILKRLGEVDEEFLGELRQVIVKEYALQVSLCDENAARIMCVEKPHRLRGFADQVKMIEAGWRRLKLIDPPKIVNNNIAGAVAGGTMAETYKSKWLRQKEAEMSAVLEVEYGQSLPDKTTS